MLTHSKSERDRAGETKESLLDAAETLFARQGVHRASLRAITTEANANLAAVHYHFGSKEGLLRAVLARRLEPLNRERLRELDRAQAADGGATVEDIVRAFVAPVLRMVESERGGHAFARFVSRTFSEPDPALRSLVLEAFDEVFRRFVGALGEALPDLPPDELYWRFLFMIGAMAHTAGFGFLMHQLSDGICDPLAVEGIIDRMVRFLAGGLESPPAGEIKR